MENRYVDQVPSSTVNASSSKPPLLIMFDYVWSLLMLCHPLLFIETHGRRPQHLFGAVEWIAVPICKDCICNLQLAVRDHRYRLEGYHLKVFPGVCFHSQVHYEGPASQNQKLPAPPYANSFGMTGFDEDLTKQNIYSNFSIFEHSQSTSAAWVLVTIEPLQI